jgi:hypothetical protein
MNDAFESSAHITLPHDHHTMNHVVLNLSNVRFWPLTELQVVAADVRFRGQRRYGLLQPQ